jgi:hypothetical protein
MKNVLSIIIYIAALTYLLQSCASPTGVTGGPRDTIPPTLLQSYPSNNTVNFNSTEITLTFDERIKADQLKSKLLITPLTENDFKFKINKEILTISFNNRFTDSTTYILNFADAVQDITESNPAINLRIAFSTGTYIDSAKISGNVKDLLENKAKEGNIVSLYKLDTNTVFKNKPFYFTYTDKKGNYKLENLKPDKYRIYSFKDENKNLLLESATEEFGFLADTLQLTRKLDSINIKTIKIDAAPLKTIRSGISGNYFEIRYSKPINNYRVSNIDTTNKIILQRSLSSDKSTIRFYPPALKIDSIQIQISAVDTLKNVQIDTITAKFQVSNRKADQLELVALPKQKQIAFDSLSINIVSNKPIKIFDNKLIFLELSNKNRIKLDSIERVTIINHSNELNLKLPRLSYLIRQYKTDSLAKLDMTSISKEDSIQYQEKRTKLEEINIAEYNVIVERASLITIENDSSKELSFSFFEPDSKSYGTVSGTITIKAPMYTIELIDKTYNVIQTTTNSNGKYKFTYVNPGNYSIRVKYNSSEEKWSVGNILKNKPPDQIYFLDKYFDIRANWDLENINIIIN